MLVTIKMTATNCEITLTNSFLKNGRFIKALNVEPPIIQTKPK